MVETFGIKRLRTISDYIEVVTARHFKEGHSAFELTHRWKNVGSRMPEPIYSIFQNSGITDVRDIEILQIYVEYPVFLDSLRTPSKNDLMIFCKSTIAPKIVVAVEAKCAETFAERVQTWIRAPDSPNSRKQRKLFKAPVSIVGRKEKRLAFLNEVLSVTISPDSHLRYQLLHRTASAILTARQTFANIAVVLIQAFTQSDSNYADFMEFCKFLGIQKPTRDTVLGPYFADLIPQTPIYFVYVQDRRQSDPPLSSLF